MPLRPGTAISGRCYCGAVTVTALCDPITVAYCHCTDCRRWTGAPVGAFAAFAASDLVTDPPLGAPFSGQSGARRWNCKTCGSPLAARFDYLPKQVYVPLGILDQAEFMPPQIHCHARSALPWLHITDGAERVEGTARQRLNERDWAQ